MNNIFTKEFLDIVDNIDRKIVEKYNLTNSNSNERLFVQMVKLQEEVGELAEVVLTSAGIQRKEKIELFKKEHLGEEISDVILATLMVAKAANMDIDKTLSDKISKIIGRGGM